MGVTSHKQKAKWPNILFVLSQSHKSLFDSGGPDSCPRIFSSCFLACIHASRISASRFHTKEDDLFCMQGLKRLLVPIPTHSQLVHQLSW